MAIYFRDPAPKAAGDWKLSEIGRTDDSGSVSFSFGKVSSLAPLPNGGFVVCDQDDVQLLMFDSLARFIQAVGRRGSGPGEYRSCIGLSASQSRGVAVSDPFNARFVEFRLDGSFSRVVANERSGYLGERTLFADSTGRLWTLATRAVSLATNEHEALYFVAFDRRGRAVDSITVPSRRASPEGRAFAVSTLEGDLLSVPPDTIWTFSPDAGLFVADPRAYRAQRVASSSVQTTAYQRDSMRPVPFEREEREQWDVIREGMSRNNGQMSFAEIPLRKPLLRELLAWDETLLWVGVHSAAVHDSDRTAIPGRARLTFVEPAAYDLFDIKSGIFLGRLVLPRRSRLLAADGDRVWLLEETSAGEHAIVVYKLSQ